jgi:hypothetical protein
VPTRPRAGFSSSCLSFVFSLCLFPCVLSANSAPTDITASNLTIAENSAIGTVIGEFNATDPDGEGNFTYDLKFNFPEVLSPVFWLDASDSSTITQSSELVSNWLDKSGNENNLIQANTSMQGRFIPTALNAKPSILFDGVNDNYKFQNSLSIQSIFMVLNTTETPRFNNWRWSFGGKTTNSNRYAFIFGRKDSANLVGNNISLNGGISAGELSFANNQNFKIIYCSKSDPVVRSDWYIGLGDAYWKGHISEVISFSNLLSENLVDQVEAYLGFKWDLESNLPSEHPAKTFSVDQNGTLTANQTFDYETDDLNYTITVRATDEHNASFDKNFTIIVANVVEDLDGDGTEDHYDDDIDGDGLTNAEELAYNSDPWDASSINRPPSDITASNLTIAENSAIGTVIGEFNATDPDGDTNITYSLLYSSGTVGWKSSRFYGDADSGINHNYKYTCAVNVGGEGLVINGVPFEGSNSHSGNGWALTSGFFNNWIDSLASSNPVYTKTNVGGGSSHLLNGFRFGGTSQKVKLTGLQIGATYVFSTYNQAWGTSGRRSTLSSTANSLTSTIEQDMYGAGDDDGLLVRHTYIANDSEVEFTFTPATGSSWHLYAFSNHKLAPFSIDENGTLTATQSFDYETESNYSITVQATDDINASSSQTFTVQITNVIEDLDGDGTEDPFDDDIDGDGVSNANEILYSSDPLDAGSTNSPPFSFSSSSLTVAENSSIGTVVGEFNGTSSNSDDNFTFRILPDAPDGFSPLLWLDAADPFTLYSEVNRTSYALSGAVAGWADKSGRDQHFGQSTSSARPSTGTRIFNGLNVLDFNGTHWMKSNADFATGTDFSIYMFAKVDAINHHNDSLFCLTPNDPDFQIDAGHSTQFRARIYQSGMGSDKIFASSAMHQAGVWAVSLSGSRSKHIGISFNGEGIGGSHSFNSVPKQTTNSLNIFSNRGQSNFPEGFVGEFIVVNNMDYPGGGGVQEYLQKKWLGGTYDHDAFFLDSNGTLLTNRPFDYEVDEQNQTIQIIASAGSRQSLPQEFTVSITDVEENLDGDGVEDFYDSDSDGDGLSNLQEFYGRSDPLNSSSSNAAPSEINATGSVSFSESLALGAIAVDFNATDANSHANLSYRVQPKIDISDVPGISGWFDASDMDSLTTDLSGNTVLSWGNQVDSSVAMVAGNKPPSSGTYLNGLHALFFDRNETMVSKKGDDVWSPWTSDGSLAGSFTDGSFFLVFRTYEVQRTSLPNLGNWWGGHMPWTGGGIFWDIHKGGEINRIWGSLTSGHENMVVSFYHSVTDSSRQFFKNGKLLVSGSPVATTVLSPVHFPSTYEEPQFLYGEMIFVRQNITHANREKIEGYLTHKWGLADQLPSDHPYAGIDFTIDENGSLRTARQFDYETDDHNYSVRIWATDDHNATTYSDFTVNLTNVFEDLDGDGTEDHYDLDIDGDGLSNADELAYNSDPWDASSSNRPPSDINVSNLTIAENSAIGSIIGEFNATDPDGDLNLTYQMLRSSEREVTSQENLLAWFKFDEQNGTTTRNYGMVGSDGSLVDGALFERAEYKFGGGALKIPAASTARVTLDSSVGIGGEESGYFSLSVWFKNLHDQSTYRALSQGDELNSFVILPSNSDNLGVWQTNNGTFRDSGYDLNVSSTVEWTNLVATFDGSTTKFYINSAIVGTSDRAPGTNIHVIGNQRKLVQPFAEYLDDFRVYEQPLSSTEVASIYGNGLGDYNAFDVDVNGTLRTAEVFDFEGDSNLSVSVRAFDEAGTFVDKNFSIVLSNVVEDLDGDGIEDHNDTDADGDGVSNLLEYLGRSDPMDVNSTNRRPSDINASVSLSVEENASIGTIIAEFNTTDLDPNSSLSFAFSPSFPTGYSPKLWLDAMDLSTLDKGDAIGARGPPENNQSIGVWQDKSGNNHHAFTVVGTPTYEENRINNSFPAVSTTRDVMLLSDTNSSFDGWDSMTISLVYQWPAGVELHQWKNVLSKGSGDWGDSAWILKTMNQNNSQGTGFIAGTGSAYKRLDGNAKTMAQNAKILTLVYNGSAGTVLIYANGHYASSSTGWPAALRANAENSIALSGVYNPSIGRYSGLSSNSFGEILIFREAVSGDYRQRLEGYFAHKWGLANDVEPFHPYKEYPLLIDANGTLKTTAFLDYETKDKNYSITVRAIDEWNATLEKQFTVLVTDIFEDLDGDGVEDHNDTDLDGDGVSNLDEFLWGSNPSDGNDVNHRPSNIIPQGSVSIAENSAVGSLVEQFSGVDAEGNESLNLSMLHFMPKLWLDASSPSSFRTNLGVGSDNPNDGDKVGLWLDKSGGSYHAKAHFDENRSRSEFMPTYRESGFNNNLPALEFNSNVMKIENSASDFDGWDELTVFAVVQQLARNMWTFWFGKSDHAHEVTNLSWCFVPRRLDMNPSVFDFYSSNKASSTRLSLSGASNSIHQPGILSISLRQNNAVMKYNGIEVATANGPNDLKNTPDLPITIGGTSLLGYGSKFLLSEFIVLNDGFNDQEIEWMEARLAYKWDVNGSLPTAHPYSDSAPPNYPPGAIFYLEDNGTLRTTTTFDYETDDLNYSITLRVTDDHNISFDKNLTISITNVVEDSDGDGTEDHYDLDIDGDGFSNAVEIAYGSNPLDPNSVANAAPNSLELNGTTILENLPAGTRVGQLHATDPDGNVSLNFRFAEGEGAEDNALFAIDQNNTLRTTQTFDYETDEHNFSIRVRVADEHNFSLEKVFVIHLLNVVEDNDGDGTEDHYDPDDDNDGFSDAEELAYGSDPTDENSVVNQAPSDLKIKRGGEFFENEPAGTWAVKFIGFDPDANDTLTYHLLSPVTGKDFPFKLNIMGGLRTLRPFDYESDDHNYTLRVRVSDERNESIEATFTIYLLNVVEDIDKDGVEDAFDKDIDGDGFTNLQELNNGTDPTNPHSTINLPILETFDALTDGNGSIQLGGKVLADGMGKIEDFGVVLSSSISMSGDANQTRWIKAKGTIYSFSLAIPEDFPSGTFYYRAWAKNVAGYGIGPIKKVSILYPIETWMGKSQELSSGWLRSEWFGFFRPSTNGWIYHAEMGWIFHSEAKDASVWLWKEGRGWLWTQNGVWPYLWSNRNQNWLFFVRGQSGRPLYFDYSTSTYK